MSADLDAIRASRAACADIPWSFPCVSGEQLDALVAEVERLRSERSLLEQEARIRRRLCNRFADEVAQLRMMVDGLETAAHEERAAIVAFLRARIERHERALRAERQAADAGDFTYSKFTEAKELLSIIERGEHRREEER